jgi:hypothetical protein
VAGDGESQIVDESEIDFDPNETEPEIDPNDYEDEQSGAEVGQNTENGNFQQTGKNSAHEEISQILTQNDNTLDEGNTLMLSRDADEDQQEESSSDDGEEIEIQVSEPEPFNDDTQNDSVIKIENFTKAQSNNLEEQNFAKKVIPGQNLPQQTTPQAKEPEMTEEEKEAIRAEKEATEKLQKVQVSESEYSPSPSASEIYKSTNTKK